MSIAALIFDMDGVLLDSEPYWRQAEMELFATVGLHLSEDDCRQTTGLRIDEVVALRHAQHPWPSPSCEELAGAILDRVIELVSRLGSPLPGVMEGLQASRQTRLPLAIASSSSYRLIEATLQRLQIRDWFPTLHSAEEEDLGKPHPAVYLRAAEKLGVPATHCLAIEDSLNGVIAAKAARMKVVAIPEVHQQQDPRFAVADYRLTNLGQFPQLLNELLSRNCAEPA